MWPQLERAYTIEEYVELFKASEELLEYRDGKVVSLTARKIAESVIAANLTRSLSNHLEGRPFHVFGRGAAVKTIAAPPFRLPDAVVVSDQLDFEDFHEIEMLLHPLVIGEVLSPIDADYDCQEKFLIYQAIESFQEYLLVAWDRPHVIRYRRQPDNCWVRSDVIGLESSVELESLGLTLALSEIYRMIEFPESEATTEDSLN